MSGVEWQGYAILGKTILRLKRSYWLMLMGIVKCLLVSEVKVA